MNNFVEMAAYWTKNLAALKFTFPDIYSAPFGVRHPFNNTDDDFADLYEKFRSAMAEQSISIAPAVALLSPPTPGLSQADCQINALFALVHGIIADRPTMALMQLFHEQYNKFCNTREMYPFILCSIAQGADECVGQYKYLYRHPSESNNVYAMLDEPLPQGLWLPYESQLVTEVGAGEWSHCNDFRLAAGGELGDYVLVRLPSRAETPRWLFYTKDNRNLSGPSSRNTQNV